MVGACIFFLILITSIRVSPALANYVSSLPGMERIVELVRFNKGILSAVENDYMQEIGVTTEFNGVKLTVDAIIVDNMQTLVFYTIESERDLENVIISEVELFKYNGNRISSYGVSAQAHEKITKEDKISGKLTLVYQEKMIIPETFILKLDLEEEDRKLLDEVEFPITVDFKKFDALKKEK
nr:DUF4179 domain-containing protein [Sutcliffiella rhizosphaerae]